MKTGPCGDSSRGFFFSGRYFYYRAGFYGTGFKGQVLRHKLGGSPLAICKNKTPTIVNTVGHIEVQHFDYLRVQHDSHSRFRRNHFLFRVFFFESLDVPDQVVPGVDLAAL